MPSKKKNRIVVVEDDTILLKALNIELMSEDYEVLSAMDGEEGLKLIKKKLPHLVLLDLVMPKMNGLDVLVELKKNAKTKKIPVIILTNLGQDHEKEKGLSLGAKDYFVKSSTDLSEVSEKIASILK